MTSHKHIDQTKNNIISNFVYLEIYILNLIPIFIFPRPVLHSTDIRLVEPYRSVLLTHSGPQVLVGPFESF